MKKTGFQIENRLAVLRQKRGLSVTHLAKLVDVSRQTIYAMEAGSYMPNTALALKLARALETCVEEIFALPDDPEAPEPRTEQVYVLPGAEDLHSGQPVQLCRVDKRIVASAPSPVPWYFPASDAIMTGEPVGQDRMKVQVFDLEEDFGKRLLVAGCDPAISVLARHALAAGVELVLAHRNSTQALALLKNGSVHVAGTHLRDQFSGESNLPQIRRMFPKNSVALIAFAVWEEGIVTARGNPKGIKGIEDLARKDVSMVNREPGAGSRLLLDTLLKQSGIEAGRVRGYDHEARGHLAAAWRVQSEEFDCCIATRAAARAFGLGFIPLISERYDLAVRRRHLELPAVQVLLDVLGRAGFRRELESLGGYDTRTAGNRVL